MSTGLERRITGLTAWVIALVAALEMIPIALDIPDYLFPRFSKVLDEFVSSPSYLLGNVAITFLEAMSGLLLVSLAGVALGVAGARIRSVGNITLRSAAVMQTIPIVAVAPLIIIWAGPGVFSKILMAALIGMPPTLVASIEGFRSTPADLIDTLRVMGTSQSRVTFQVRVPYALSHLSVGLRVSAALCVIGAIVAEYAGSTSGIGYVIMQSSYRLDTATLFAAVLGAIVCGLAMVALAQAATALAQRIVRWR